MIPTIEIRRYITSTGKDVFGTWLIGLKDAKTKAKIVVRVDRLATGNFGDCKSLGGGLFELRIDWGPVYRVTDLPEFTVPESSVWLAFSNSRPSKIENIL